MGNLEIEKSREREREREKARKRASECDYFVVLNERQRQKCNFLGEKTLVAIKKQSRHAPLLNKINNMSAEALESISTDDLMKEVQRRIDCAKKPEKRIILIGAFALSFVLFIFFRSFFSFVLFRVISLSLSLVGFGKLIENNQPQLRTRKRRSAWMWQRHASAKD